MQITVSIAALVILYAGTVSEVPKTFCNDTEATAQWQAARDQFQGTPKGDDVDQLWQTRKMLCRQLASGEISLRAANDTFESLRKRTVEKWSRKVGDPREGSI